MAIKRYVIIITQNLSKFKLYFTNIFNLVELIMHFANY